MAARPMPLRRSTRNIRANCGSNDQSSLTDANQPKPAKVNGGRVRKTRTQTKKKKSPAQPRKRKSPEQNKRRKVTRTKSNPQRQIVSSTSQSKPQVISLDVTFSETDDDTSDIEEIPSPPSLIVTSKSSEKNYYATALPSDDGSSIHMKDGRCIIPDSDDDQDVMPVPAVKSKKPEHTKTKANLSFSDSESDDDLYGVHYTEKRNNAYRIVQKEYKDTREDPSPSRGRCLASSSKCLEEEERETPSAANENSSSSILGDDDDDDNDDAKKGSSSPGKNFSSKLDIDNIDVSSIVLKGSAGKRRSNKVAKQAMASLQAFSKRYQEDIQRSASSLNDSLVDDDVLMADGCNTSIPIRLRWGTTYLRHTINRSKKLIVLYQEIAEKHKVSVSKVVLSFRDSVISPDTTATQIGLSIGDIIEGGLLQNQCDVKTSVNSKPETSADENSINLKVQTASRKTFHVLQINKYDRMAVLIDKYAELRGIPAQKLRFKFDGEALDPTETPFALDLEGDECIDVFELT